MRVRAVVVLLLLAAACGDDGGNDAEAIESRDEWCAVIGDVDEQFEHTDNSGDSFRTKQAEYAEIKRRLDALSSAIDLVDGDARADVHASLAWAANLTTAFVTATSEDAAVEAVDAVFEDVEYGEGLPGSQWILDACGVDVNG